MIQGSLVAIVTPMHTDGRIDEDAFRRLVDWHAEEGTDAIVAVGTTGESATLDEEEHCAAIALVVEQALDVMAPAIEAANAVVLCDLATSDRCVMPGEMFEDHFDIIQHFVENYTSRVQKD